MALISPLVLRLAGQYAPWVRLDKIAIVVDDYDQAIRFFTSALGFELVEDSPSLTNDGRPKRWVVVRPPGAETGILLARADGQDQAAADQHYLLWAQDGSSCNGTAPNDDPNYAAAGRDSAVATSAKYDFLTEWEPVRSLANLGKYDESDI